MLNKYTVLIFFNLILKKREYCSLRWIINKIRHHKIVLIIEMFRKPMYVTFLTNF